MSSDILAWFVWSKVVLESGKQACPPLATTGVKTLRVWAVGYQTSAKTTTVKYKPRRQATRSQG